MEKLRNVARFGKYGKRLCMMFLFLCITTSGLMRASIFAQTTVTAKFRNVTLNEVLWEIQKQTDFTFIYSTNDAKKVRVENLDVKNELISEVLNKCLRNSGLTYTVHDGVIAIRKAEPVRTETVAREKYTITGKVIEDSGEPIIGANVIVKGTTNGVITDIDGNFVLNNAKGTLVISYIGYKTVELPIGDKTNFNVKLVEDSELLSEVVVTGYGVAKKASLTSAISQVKGDDVFKNRGIANTTLALQGEVPGLVVTRSSTRPGSEGAAIKIRGDVSMNGNDPLIIIDGVAGSLSELNSMDGNDIENISVLKDASAAIYGARSAYQTR